MMNLRQDKQSERPATPALDPPSSSRLWLRLSVSLAVALAFADASIVVLALPQIVDRLHTTISHVTWVIIAYNLALIIGAVVIIPVAPRIASRGALIIGLAVFGLGSLGSGAANSLGFLVAMRVVQGAGGALLLCASLPLFASAARPGESPLVGWAAAAAVGAAIGPAAGGILTQGFDWRAIFFAQAPVAAIAALSVSAAHSRASQQPAESSEDAGGPDPGPGDESRRLRLDPAAANVALTLLSAGLIGALFLVTILLINVWGLTPLGAAGIVSAIPLATVLAERTNRHRSAATMGAVGAIVLAAGLVGLALVTHRQLAWVLVALGLCGAGLGMAFPALTSAALRRSGTPVARAARTVAARDAGLVLGLLILTPIWVHQLNLASKSAVPSVATAVIGTPLPDNLKTELAAGLIAANASAPQSQLPDFRLAFNNVRAAASRPVAARLTVLQNRIHSLVEHAATHSFRRPLLYCAVFALLVLPLLALRLTRLARPPDVATTGQASRT